MLVADRSLRTLGLLDMQRNGRASWGVEGAAHSPRSQLEDVEGDHRRGHIALAEEFLDRADVVAALEGVRGEGVAEGVAGHALGEAAL